MSETFPSIADVLSPLQSTIDTKPKNPLIDTSTGVLKATGSDLAAELSKAWGPIAAKAAAITGKVAEVTQQVSQQGIAATAKSQLFTAAAMPTQLKDALGQTLINLQQIGDDVTKIVGKDSSQTSFTLMKSYSVTGYKRLDAVRDAVAPRVSIPIPKAKNAMGAIRNIVSAKFPTMDAPWIKRLLGYSASLTNPSITKAVSDFVAKTFKDGSYNDSTMKKVYIPITRRFGDIMKARGITLSDSGKLALLAMLITTKMGETQVLDLPEAWHVLGPDKRPERGIFQIHPVNWSLLSSDPDIKAVAPKLFDDLSISYDAKAIVETSGMTLILAQNFARLQKKLTKTLDPWLNPVSGEFFSMFPLSRKLDQRAIELLLISHMTGPDVTVNSPGSLNKIQEAKTRRLPGMHLVQAELAKTNIIRQL